VKLTFLATLLIGLFSASSVDAGTAAVRADRPIDVELDRLGSLPGAMDLRQQPSRETDWVLVYRGRRMVAKARVGADGSFRIERLGGGLYWVTSLGIGQAVRAWATGTAPPRSQRRLLLASAPTQPTAADSRTVVRGQAPYAIGPGSGYVVQAAPAYPFQPYQVPGAGIMYPGTYTSPGAAFFSPLVTAAVVTGIAGVIIVAADDDDDSASNDLAGSSQSASPDFDPDPDPPPASP